MEESFLIEHGGLHFYKSWDGTKRIITPCIMLTKESVLRSRKYARVQGNNTTDNDTCEDKVTSTAPTETDIQANGVNKASSSSDTNAPQVKGFLFKILSESSVKQLFNMAAGERRQRREFLEKRLQRGGLGKLRIDEVKVAIKVFRVFEAAETA